MQTSSSPSPSIGEVLAELSVDEVASSELAFPVAVGVDLVDEDGALLAAVAGQIALAVAVDVELAHPARAGDRVLEDAGEDGLPLPGHVLRHADVDGQQGAHRMASLRRRERVGNARHLFEAIRSCSCGWWLLHEDDVLKSGERTLAQANANGAELTPARQQPHPGRHPAAVAGVVDLQVEHEISNRFRTIPPGRETEPMPVDVNVTLPNRRTATCQAAL